MHKMGRLFAWLTFVIALVCGAQLVTNTATVHAQLINSDYLMIEHAYDWGPAVDQVVIRVNQPIKGTDLNAKTFSVSNSNEYIDSTPRTVTKAYLSDIDGKKVDSTSSRFITLNMTVHPTLNVARALSYRNDSGLSIPVKMQYQITQEHKLYTQSGQVIDDIAPIQTDTQVKAPQAKVFSPERSFTYQDKHFGTQYMNYTTYSPKNEQKHALVIWLHGAGEGGYDNNQVGLYGTNLVDLATNKFQKYFDGGFDILIPQAKTYWMDSRKTTVENRDDIGGLGTKDTTSEDAITQHTRYEDALDALIQDYLASHPKVDRSRIYIGGCSNGGYLAMRMLVKDPSKYSAVFPICEGYLDKNISDSDISAIKDTPIWFTQSAGDKVIDSQQNGIPTYKRLVAADAKNVHFTLLNGVYDETGQFKDLDTGKPYQYNDHFSWLNVLDDYPATEFDGTQTKNSNGTDTTVFSWLAKQHKVTSWK
ncbi:prolyl oligopeptidase family serine peptidase [Companilactobacillus ginsenosidimutans]|uniref:Peptidase n=1 Tax=Companilactobacillus ginsenosidimutans TaxID=1007676 RepID=A0A0H4R0U3_9LACO|nr:prolyl oligopeptidase family serine peptidase [Companilactobacillus ginsenosidimutans]AKP67345.1 hypothetical protein ABM34_07195 [Companilactobacillus ginsenosidimutans]